MAARCILNRARESSMPTMMKLYAAIHDQIAEGHVWLKKDGIPPRCIVQITNTDNRHRVYCDRDEPLVPL
jgi:hypothetical protein